MFGNALAFPEGCSLDLDRNGADVGVSIRLVRMKPGQERNSNATIGGEQ